MRPATRFLASLLLLAQALMGFMPKSSAYDFYVGGKDGWTPSPSEAYNNWAARNRFQVNDKLVFKYNKGEDSVLVVNKDDYDSCNTSNPIRKLEDGDSVFRFDHSGHFFFISGVHERCQKGEKMVVAVMAMRPSLKTPPPSPSATAPSPSVSVLLSPSQPPNTGGAFVQAPAPAPLSGDSSSSSYGPSISMVGVGLVAVVFGGAYVV